MMLFQTMKKSGLREELKLKDQSYQMMMLTRYVIKIRWIYLSPKVNTTSNVQNTDIWHSTFCNFWTSWSIFYWLLQQRRCGFLLSNFCAKVMRAMFCNKVECHWVIFWYYWGYLLKYYYQDIKICNQFLVVYMCSSWLQLAPGLRELSHAEKKITVM